jgi:hypothetical protein
MIQFAGGCGSTVGSLSCTVRAGGVVLIVEVDMTSSQKQVLLLPSSVSHCFLFKYVLAL